MSTGFIGDRSRGSSRGGRRSDALPIDPADPVSVEAGAVARALARTRLRHFADRPVVTRGVLATFGLVGLGLVVVPAMTATRLPESLAPAGTASATAYVLAVAAMTCGASVLILTGVLARRALRLGADDSVAEIIQSVAVCLSGPDDLTGRQRSELIEILQEVADQLRRLSDAASADRVETSCALLEGHRDQSEG